MFHHKEGSRREAGPGALTVPPSLVLSPRRPHGSSGLLPTSPSGGPLLGGVSGLSGIGDCGRRPGWLASPAPLGAGSGSSVGNWAFVSSSVGREQKALERPEVAAQQRPRKLGAAAQGPAGACQGPHASPARRLRPWAVQVGVCKQPGWPCSGQGRERLS